MSDNAPSTTLDTVARLAGVSRATVSRVVNNHPNVREAVRVRVQDALVRQGYQPHMAARALASRRGHAIGLVVPRSFEHVLTDEFFAHIARGVSSACQEFGHFMTLLSVEAGTTMDREPMYLHMLGGGYHGGVVIVGFNEQDPIASVLAKLRLPFVSIGQQIGAPDVPYVDVDNFGGALQATQYLLGLGHRRIAHISGHVTAAWTQHRISGYREALSAGGVGYDEALVIASDFTREGGFYAMQRLLEQKPTAVFVGSDAMALGAMQALQSAGFVVPQDVSLISFDGLPSAANASPSLTTVTQPVSRLGRVAVEMLYEIMHAGATTTPPNMSKSATRAVCRIVPAELTIRASTSAPAAFALP